MSGNTVNVDYSDITERAGPPIWWDENAVPRYVPFAPKHCDIYAREVVLMVIACQGCRTEFNVAMSSVANRYDLSEGHPTLLFLYGGPPHFGDPPNAGGCPAGPTMNVDFVRVLEHWVRENHQWTRCPRDPTRTG